jgi:hypothetical protein
MTFIAMDANFDWRLNSEPNGIPTHFQDPDMNVVRNFNRLILPTRQNQHGATPRFMSASKKTKPILNEGNMHAVLEVLTAYEK